MSDDPLWEDVIREARSPDGYADHETHIYVLYGLVERLAVEVRRLGEEVRGVTS